MNIDETLFAASLRDDLPTIDLHRSQSVVEAKEQLEQELFFFVARGETVCRVVYGIGEGVLAREIEQVLSTHPLVGGWGREESGGSAIVIL